jgi:dipeptidase E
MGEIFLAGGGKEYNDSEVGGIFFKGIKRILYIPLAWPNDDFQNCLVWFKGVAEKFGKIEIDMLTDANNKISLDKYDGIFIGGGNTFKLLKKLKEGNLDKKLIKYYKNGGKIFGGSAGAIIFGKDINLALICKDKDVNLVKLKNTKGMNLLKNYDIQAHYENNQLKEHLEYITKTKRNILAIPEGSAIILTEKGCKVIGLKPVIVISKDKIKKYNVGDEIQIGNKF